ncbi:MAG TPA: OmpW family outer membrane protein [Methylocella sp.]|nr:OmpW family outer membrane protein [Methylocella sp.]
MTGVLRIWAAALIAAFTISRASAADLTPAPEPLPPPPPLFFLHVGALGIFFEPNAQSTGGGFFNYLPIPANALPTGNAQGAITNVAIRPNYTLGLEAGWFVTPNIALAISAGVPPIAHLKATGLTLVPELGTNSLGSVRHGPAMFLLQYHFNNWGLLQPFIPGNLQPYLGVGAVYLLNFGNINDGILTNLAVDQNFGFVVQGGIDYMLTQNWGLFADVKHLWLSTDVSGDLLNLNIPIRTHVQLDPWAASAGITFKY